MPLTRAAALLLAVLAIPVLAAGPGNPGRAAPMPVPALQPGNPTAGNFSVEIAPDDWSLPAGANVTLTASWIGASPGCTVAPGWYRWSVRPGPVGGTLLGTNNSSTTYFAPTEGGGNATVALSAGAAVRCGGLSNGVAATASANLTVLPPLTLGPVRLGPDPVAPGAPTSLSSTLSGGEPPYTLRVDWGDGNVSQANLTAAGPFSLEHTYGFNGTFVPELLAADAAGQSVSGEPEEPLYASSGFVAALLPSAPVAEVGFLVSFAVALLAAPGNFSWTLSCENASPVNEAPGLAVGCAFRSAGPAVVAFTAVGARPPYSAASATLVEPVAAPPSVAFPSGPSGAEAGGDWEAPVALAGGVGPYSLQWSLVGTGTGGTAVLAEDGSVDLPLSAPAPGAFTLSVVAQDALGATSVPAAERVEVAPVLSATVRASAAPGPVGATVNVSGSVLEGPGPFDWTVAASEPAGNGTVPVGALLAPGPFDWNASWTLEGSLELVVTVVDADGGTDALDLHVGAVPVLALSLGAALDGSGGVRLDGNLTGGLAPYAYRWNDTAGDAGNGTLPGPGPFSVAVASSTRGPTRFDLTVVDALGYSVSAEANATVPDPTPAAPARSSFALALGLAALAGVAGFALAARRRPRSAPGPPPPDPVAVLREVIEPSDGVDRGLVEQLAEERGVPRELARSTLERLKADGTVRFGRGDDGEEVLAWAGPLGR